MGISSYHRYKSTVPPIGSIASNVKNRKRKTKKKKGGRRKKRTRKKRGGVGFDDEGYFVKYNTPELLEYARKNRLEQKYLFKHRYSNKLEHVWLTWNEYENIKRDIDLYNLNNYDNLNASEIPQMMNTIFPEEQIALPNLVTIEPIFKKPINTINDLTNTFKEDNDDDDVPIDINFDKGYVKSISEQNLKPTQRKKRQRRTRKKTRKPNKNLDLDNDSITPPLLRRSKKRKIKHPFVGGITKRKKTKRGGGTRKKSTKNKIIQYANIKEELKNLNESREEILLWLERDGPSLDMRWLWGLENDLNDINKEIEKREQTLLELENFINMLKKREIGK